MARFTDSLRGYAFAVHKRDGWVCQYCGLDGTKRFSDWLALSWDHLLPKDHQSRDDPNFITTACFFCNVADNRYFDYAQQRGLIFEGLSRTELIEQRRPFVERTRASYQSFWKEKVEVPAR